MVASSSVVAELWAVALPSSHSRKIGSREKERRRVTNVNIAPWEPLSPMSLYLTGAVQLPKLVHQPRNTSLHT